MTSKEIVKINSRGLIMIPLGIRKKYHLTKGTSVAIIEEEGNLSLVPLIEIENLREQFCSRKEMAEIIDQADEEERELEL